MGILFLIGLIVLLIVSAVVVYKTAEVHELHKMRAAFEDKKIHIQNFLNEHKDSDLEHDYEYYIGEIMEIEELESLIDEELEILKNFDFGLSD